MLAFTNTLVTKDQILAQLRAHAEADEITKGTYWQNGKGCAIGCTIHSDDHAQYEPRFGIPMMLAHLEDCIFEGLPNGEAKAWPMRFMLAIPPGADLSRVGWQFLHWFLTDKSINPGVDHPLVRDAIKQCADILVPLTQGLALTERAAESAARAVRVARSMAWRAAESAGEIAAGAARRAAASAGESAAGAARSAASAAWIAAWSAASAMESAVESVAKSVAESAMESARSARSAAASAKKAAESAMESESAAESAASAATWVSMSDKLVELIHASGEAT